LYTAVKKLQKLVNICQSYHNNKRVSIFYGPQCIVKINDTSSVLLLCGSTVMYKCSDLMTYITTSLNIT